MKNKQIRVLIVDDSALIRHALREILESDTQLRVVGEAVNGREALALVARLKPDVITMDVRMPVMDGLEATEHLMAYHPTPILVITSSLSRYDIDITFQMLGAGALEVIEKSSLLQQGSNGAPGQELVRRVKAVAGLRVVTHLRGRRRATGIGGSSNGQWRLSSPPPSAANPTMALAPRPHDNIRRTGSTGSLVPAAQPGPASSSPPVIKRETQTGCPVVIIGASAGGPRIVYRILRALPSSLRATVVVVQHIAEGFGAGMAEWLSGASTPVVHLAQHGMTMLPGRRIVAPDSKDLLFNRAGAIVLDSSPLLVQRSRPSVDIAMQSAAAIFGPRVIGIILTGMGNDGALGMQAIRRAGGYTYAQDEASAPIYGMPRAAVELGAVDAVLTPDDIVASLLQRVEALWQELPA